LIKRLNCSSDSSAGNLERQVGTNKLQSQGTPTRSPGVFRAGNKAWKVTGIRGSQVSLLRVCQSSSPMNTQVRSASSSQIKAAAPHSRRGTKSEAAKMDLRVRFSWRFLSRHWLLPINHVLTTRRSVFPTPRLNDERAIYNTW
jgi:hypothetical protein